MPSSTPTPQALAALTLLTHACVIRPATGGEWEYALWAIGHGHLNADPTLPRT